MSETARRSTSSSVSKLGNAAGPVMAVDMGEAAGALTDCATLLTALAASVPAPNVPRNFFRFMRDEAHLSVLRKAISTRRRGKGIAWRRGLRFREIRVERG